VIHALVAAIVLAADSGPAADVTAVRAAETASWPAHPSAGTPVKISNVRVVGDYAVLEWTNGESGGMSAYHRTSSGTWKRFMSGGGAFAASDLEKQGCPGSIARQLVPGSPG
jgi:hypothetical protein